MKFATPIALLLLLVIPYFVWLGWPRLRYRRQRDTASLTIRLVIVVLLILALAGTQVVQAADKLSVVFLVDASDSIDQSARAQAQQYIHDAMSHMSPEDKAGIVVFGKNALVERPVSSGKDLGPITSTPIQLETNIADAIRLALAMFPTDAAKRIVILSDGQETQGSAVKAAELAAATNVQIDVVPLQRQQGPEVLISDVRLPTSVAQSDLFDMNISIQSELAVPADITVLSAGVTIQTKRVDLKVGTNNYVLTLKSTKQGFIDFQVSVTPVGKNTSDVVDTFYQNNELAAFTEVNGPPRILLVTSKPEETAALLPALKEVNMEVDTVGPQDLPIGLAPLAQYKTVVMTNVSATNLTDQQMRVLQSYVRDLGGGLVVIGGPNSYGVGGYFRTPLEEMLPVEMRIKDQKRVPRLTMIYVIDRSGSMEEIGPSGITNLELSKEAARRSINFLFPEDRAGVLSFDSTPEWLVPIQPVNNRDAIINQIGGLRPGGGTDIYAAVAEINRTLPSDPSTLKHVILLTDGGADPTGIVDMVKKMHDTYGITVTSIGIGQFVPPFMRDIAVAGGGIYYGLQDLQTIPQIFAAETVLATRSYIVEKEFTPGLAANSQIMQGIDATPSLLGYVATTAKDTATVILKAPGFDDPLLATWQYGLGRTVAWTSDATSRWSKNWISWPGFGRFWRQVIRSTITEGLTNKLDERVEVRDGQAYLVVDAIDDKGGFINGLNLQGAVVDPTLQSQPVQLRQVAPGRYEAPIDPQKEGAYFIRVVGAGGIDGNTQGVAQTTGWVLSYSPEYRLRTTNTTLLQQLADMTSGKNLTDKTDAVFSHDIREQQASTSLWPWMLLAAVLLLPVDIAVRRLIITRGDLEKVGAWIQDRIGMLSGPAMATATSGRLTQLKTAKERASQTLPTSTSLAANLRAMKDQERAVSTSSTGQSSVQDAPSFVQTVRSDVKPSPRVETSTTAVPSEQSSSATPADGTLASRLLDKRRTRQ